MHEYSQFSFWIQIAVTKICFSHVVKSAQNTSVLESTVPNYFINVLSLLNFNFSSAQQSANLLQWFSTAKIR